MERVRWAAERPGAMCGKPKGGYALIPIKQILAAWASYQSGGLEYRDLRAWWGCHEMLSRRCECDRGRLPNYRHEELAKLTGCPVRASVRALEREKLVTWSNHHLKFVRVSEELPDALGVILSQVTNHNRVVPVPRSTVRMLAQCGRPAVMATVIGLLCRCVYYRAGEPVSWGRMTSAWVAKTFDVSLRAVKSSMSHLAGIGWLIKAPTKAWATKRYGGAYVVNLDWSRPNTYADVQVIPAREAVKESAPVTPKTAIEIAPVRQDRNPLSRFKHQKPPVGRPTGFSKSEGEGGKNPPTWKHVERCDLTDSGRLLALFDSAVQAGAIGASEHERVSFFAAAEHAIVHGTSNPCGLFVRTVKLKRWKYLTGGDDDAARRRLARELYGSSERSRSAKVVVPKVKVRELTQEQKLAQAIERVCEQKKLPPMVVIRSMKLDWTAERFESLLEEAEAVRNESLSRYAVAAAP